MLYKAHPLDLRAEVDYLLHSSDDRAGALAFGLNRDPPAPRRDFNQTIDLARLQHLADRLIAEEDETEKRPEDNHAEQVQELLLLGTSMGGAPMITLTTTP